jgi:hypothetical protein
MIFIKVKEVNIISLRYSLMMMMMIMMMTITVLIMTITVMMMFIMKINNPSELVPLARQGFC